MSIYIVTSFCGYLHKVRAYFHSMDKATKYAHDLGVAEKEWIHVVDKVSLGETP